MADRWYDSTIAEGVGIGAIILATTFGFGKGCGCTVNSSTSLNELEMARIEKGYTLKQEDLNGDGNSELFYEINGVKYFSIIDGRNLEDTLNE